MKRFLRLELTGPGHSGNRTRGGQQQLSHSCFCTRQLPDGGNTSQQNLSLTQSPPLDNSVSSYPYHNTSLNFVILHKNEQKQSEDKKKKNKHSY